MGEESRKKRYRDCYPEKRFSQNSEGNSFYQIQENDARRTDEGDKEIFVSPDGGRNKKKSEDTGADRLELVFLTRCGASVSVLDSGKMRQSPPQYLQSSEL